MAICSKFWGTSRLPQTTSSEIDPEESISLDFNDDDFELIDEEDLKGYAPDATPDQRSSTRTYPRLPSWPTFMKQRGASIVSQAEAAEATTGPDEEPSFEGQEEISMSAQAQPEDAAPLAEDEVARQMVEDLRNEHGTALKDLSSRIETIDIQLDGSTSALFHMQKYQQAYTRDIRDLQRQIAKANVPVEWHGTLYDIVKRQIQELYFEAEKKAKADYDACLDKQLTKIRKAHDKEMSELRDIVGLQAGELQTLRDRLDQIENAYNRHAPRGARSSDRVMQPDFHLGI